MKNIAYHVQMFNACVELMYYHLPTLVQFKYMPWPIQSQEDNQPVYY